MTEQKTAPAPPAHGTICWHELYTRDPEKVKPFYAAMFGWSYDSMPMPQVGEDAGEGEYLMMKRPDEVHFGGVQAMTSPQFEGVPPHWLTYIAVDDIEASTAKVETLGGEVKMGVTTVQGAGRFSVIADPGGAVFCLWQQTAMDC